jgi:hypothetical protein
MMRVCVRWAGACLLSSVPSKRHTHNGRSLSQDGARVVLVFLESFVQMTRCARNAYHDNSGAYTRIIMYARVQYWSVVVHHTPEVVHNGNARTGYLIDPGAAELLRVFRPLQVRLGVSPPLPPLPPPPAPCPPLQTVLTCVFCCTVCRLDLKAPE